MENSSGREVLCGVEVEVFDLIAEVVTSEEWSKLLRAPLERAAGQGNRGLAQKLLRAGAERGDALNAAVRGGHGEIVNDLLDEGASVNDTYFSSYTPLHFAALEGRTEMVQLLLLKGAHINGIFGPCTPLFLAVSEGHVDAALALLAAGANVHVRHGCDSDSPVIVEAAEKGNVDILRAVIEHGADVNATTGKYWMRTPLHEAASQNNAEAIDVLVKAGANIEACARHDRTPLHYAVLNFSADAALALLKHGADVDPLDTRGRTPLSWAANKAGSRRASEMVDLLLRSGADETITNKDGETAADIIGALFDDEEGDPLVEDVERVRRLLANAPTDRAWRRRGYLVMCRALPDRMRQVQESRSGQVTVARRTRRDAKLGRSEGCDDNRTEGCGAVVGYNIGGDWVDVVSSLLGLQEEEIFRTIVGYL